MSLKVEIGRSNNNGGRPIKIGVDSWAKASRIVRCFIQDFNLGAGCGALEAFTGGKVFDGEKQVGHISYNGRAWNMSGIEIAA